MYLDFKIILFSLSFLLFLLYLIIIFNKDNKNNTGIVNNKKVSFADEFNKPLEIKVG
jgi:hypothetical protein|tara:strand:+ start:3614 stop:3784 length:171 start_codon:yes stop_codon:yes gene_type:complete